MRLGIGGRLSTVVILQAPPGTPEEPPPRPGRPPRLRGLGPGEVVIHDGPQSVTVTYGDDGRWVETARSREPDTLAGVVPIVARGSGRPVELVAEYVAGLDLKRHGPGRVHLPVPLPGGVPGVWHCGLYAIREALFDGRVPWTARWVVADGYAGTALAWDATREDALSAWRAEVQGVRPSPPKPEKPALPAADSVERHEEDPGRWSASVTTSGPPSDVPQPEPNPETTPAVLIPLESRPESSPPWGAWERLIGRYGSTVNAVLRQDRPGFTQCNDHPWRHSASGAFG